MGDTDRQILVKIDHSAHFTGVNCDRRVLLLKAVSTGEAQGCLCVTGASQKRDVLLCCSVNTHLFLLL